MTYLDKINSPKDLKNIPKEELGEVCKELRTYITDTINEIGGHLAPTLGAVRNNNCCSLCFRCSKRQNCMGYWSSGICSIKFLQVDIVNSQLLEDIKD